MIKKLQHIFALSEKGAKDLVKAVIWCFVCNLALMFPIGAVLFTIQHLLGCLEGGGSPTDGFWLYVGSVSYTHLAEMTLEDDYGMIDGVLNNGRKGEEQEKAQGEAHRGAPEKRPSIRERLAEAKRECGERKPPDRAQQKKPPEHDL